MKLLSDYERLLQEYTCLSLNGSKPVPQPGNWLPLSWDGAECHFLNFRADSFFLACRIVIIRQLDECLRPPP